MYNAVHARFIWKDTFTWHKENVGSSKNCLDKWYGNREAGILVLGRAKQGWQYEVGGRGCERLTKTSEIRKSLVETTMRTNFFGIGFEGIYTHYSKHNWKSMPSGVKRPREEPSNAALLSRCVVKLLLNIYIYSHWLLLLSTLAREFFVVGVITCQNSQNKWLLSAEHCVRHLYHPSQGERSSMGEGDREDVKNSQIVETEP